MSQSPYQKDHLLNPAAPSHELPELYHVEPLALKKPTNLRLPRKAKAHVIVGRLAERLLISVPESTTDEAAQQLARMAEKSIGEPVFIVTHNVQFLQARKLTEEETRMVLGANAEAEAKEVNAQAEA
jgi:hypothetical protein